MYLTQNISDTGMSKLSDIYQKRPSDAVLPDRKMIKIVGDDVPAGSSNTSSKIVGDVMESHEQTAANMAVQSSMIMDIMSKVVMIEQILVSEFQVRNGQTMSGAMADIRSVVQGTPVLYKFVQSNTCNTLYGSHLNKNHHYTYNQAGTAVVPIAPESTTLEVAYTTLTIPQYTNASVPLVANVTMQQLGDLMTNASIGEFASLLRTKTRSNDVDTLSMIMAKAYDPIVLKTGYSFSGKLAKLLGYMMAYHPIPLRDENEISSTGLGIIVDNTFGDNLTRTFGGVAGITDFPWSSINGAPTDNNNRSIGICGYGTYCDLLTNRLDKSPIPVLGVGINNPYDPNTWDRQTAVCFCTMSEAQNFYVLPIRALSDLAYPIMECFAGQGITEYNINQDGSYTILPNPPPNASWYPWINTAVIEGPKMGILFVVTDVETIPATTSFSYVTPANVISPYPIRNPWVNATVLHTNFMAAPYSFRSRIMDEIRRWEEIYGNNSDRASALRWAAENSKMNPWNIWMSQDGAGNAISGLTLNGRGQNNIWQNFTAAGIAGTGRENTYISSTPTYCCRSRWVRTTNPNDQWNANYANFGQKAGEDAPLYAIGAVTNPIDFLLNRSWARPFEEYPTRIYDPIRTCMAVNEMSDCMSALLDLVYQANGVTMFMANASSATVAGPFATNHQRFMQNIVDRAVRQIATAGIQYPSFMILGQAHQNSRSIRSGPTEDNYSPPYFSHVNNISIFGRVPADIIAKCNAAILNVDPVMNFGQFAQSGHTVMRYVPAGTYGRVNPEIVNAVLLDKAKPSIMWETRKLTFTALGNDVNAVRLTLTGRLTGRSYRVFLPLDRPGPWLRVQTMFQNFWPATSTSNLIPLPNGSFFPAEDALLGGDRFYISTAGPRDAYAKATASSSIYSVIQFGSANSIVGNALMNEFNEQQTVPGDLISAVNFL